MQPAPPTPPPPPRRRSRLRSRLGRALAAAGIAVLALAGTSTLLVLRGTLAYTLAGGDDGLDWLLGRAPPDLLRVARQDTGPIHFSYPANWSVDIGDGSEPAVTVSAPQDAAIHAFLYVTENDPEAEMLATREELTEQGWHALDEPTPVVLGEPGEPGEPGEGGEGGEGGDDQGGAGGRNGAAAWTWLALNETVTYAIRVELRPVEPRRLLEIREIVAVSAADIVAPGFELVRRTLAVRLSAPPPPDLRRPAACRKGFLSFQHPGNWDVEESGDVRRPFFRLVPPQDAAVEIHVYDRRRDLDAEIGATLRWYGGEERPLEVTTAFDAWGSLAGKGVRFAVDRDGSGTRRLHGIVFTSYLSGGRVLEVRATWHLDEADAVLDGLRLVERSLRIGR